MPEETVTKFGVTIGRRITCYNPDGSSWVCTVLGTAGNGPETCTKNPAPATPPDYLKGHQKPRARDTRPRRTT
jgi:hypothetical protein